MNLLMSSCSHFGNFLSDPIRKQLLHVKESSGKQPGRGTGSGKAEAYEFLNLASFRKVPSQEVRDPNSLGNQSLNQHGVSGMSRG